MNPLISLFILIKKRDHTQRANVSEGNSYLIIFIQVLNTIIIVINLQTQLIHSPLKVIVISGVCKPEKLITYIILVYKH